MSTRGAALCAALALSRIVYAGGFELPGNGTEALGRGGAFTAKATDGTALDYNIAGLARQRGTRLLLDGNLVLSTYELQRDGVYPGSPSSAQPWAGQAYPLVRDTGGPFFAPFFALSTDFGLDRWTFAVGVFGPSSVGNRTYPLSIGGLPSPARYDVVQALPLLVFPTLAAAVRVTRWLDLGMALHLAVGHFDLTSVSYTDLSSSNCPNAEYQPCDATNHVVTNGVTATASLGLMLRPLRWWTFGANVRGPVYLNSSGTVNATPPAILKGQTIMPSTATMSTALPWILRLGTRFILVQDEELEKVDFELDATWEHWSAAQGNGPTLSIAQLSIFTDINPTIVHHYHDTFSLRAGTGYNARLPVGVLGVRLGLFYDSSATAPKDTRLDFDTLAKLGVTVGAGYSVHGFSINVAYAYIYDFDRTVSDGDIAPINGAQHGMPIDAQGDLLPAVNNGRYHGQTHIVSFGVTLRFDELVGRKHAGAWPQAQATPPRPIVARAVDDEPAAATETADRSASERETTATTDTTDTTQAKPAASDGDAAAAASDDDALRFAPERVTHTRTQTHKAKKRRRHARVYSRFWSAGF